MTNQNRQPKGTTAGGQFATCHRCEQQIVIPLSEPAVRTEPDDLDYEHAAQDCLTQSGLDALDIKDFDAYRRHIGFEGSTEISAIESDYLSEELATKLQSVISTQGGDHIIKFHPWSDIKWGNPPQLWSTPLSDDEREAALAAFDAQGVAVDEPQLRYWEAGDSPGLSDWTSTAEPTLLWKQIGKTVASASPAAKQRLELAEALADNVRKEWNGQCDYLSSDAWVSDQEEDS